MLLQLLSSCLHTPIAHLLLWEGQRHAKKRSHDKKNQINFRIFEKITWHPPPPDPALLFHLLFTTAFAENQCRATVSPRSHQSIVVHQEAASPACSSQSGPRLDLCRMISLNNISSFNMSRCAAISLHSSRASRLFLTHFSVNRRVHRHCRLLQHHGDDGGPA